MQEGYLKTEGGLLGGKKRYFKLDGCSLHYFKEKVPFGGGVVCGGGDRRWRPAAAEAAAALVVRRNRFSRTHTRCAGERRRRRCGVAARGAWHRCLSPLHAASSADSFRVGRCRRSPPSVVRAGDVLSSS